MEELDEGDFVFDMVEEDLNDLVFNADADTEVDLENDAVLDGKLLILGEAVSVALPLSVFDAEHVLLTAHAEVKATRSRSLR